MKNILWGMILAAGVSQAGLAFADQPNELSAIEAKSGWRLLFDGKSADGWRNYKKDGLSSGWTIEDGALVRKDQGAGDIISKEQFQNFELMLEYKISPEGNSGLMFHVQETENAPWQTGPEVQIQDNVKGHDPQKSGWLYQLYSPPTDPATGETTDATRPAGEWNQIYLRITEQGCEICMNGVRYATFKIGNDDWNKKVAESKFNKYPDFGKTKKGHICLQDHGNVVAFRNIKVRVLDGDAVPNPVDGALALKPVLAFPNLTWAGWEPVDADGRPQSFRPIVVTYPPDASNRIVVAEQHGTVYVFDNDPAVTQSKLVLDIRDRVQYSDRQNEEGLLGLAFHPNFKDNGYVFIYYTEKPGQKSSISRFTVNKETFAADPASEKKLLRIEQPFWNHNGGTLSFGPDGYLYISLGDGGAGNDPYRNAQNLKTLLGSVLRIDVNQEQDGKAYGIPKDNPFVGRTDALPEIYAYGFRNIWRHAFDRETGTLWCGEVGQNLWEEINIIEKGGNYGWDFVESNHPFGKHTSGDKKLIAPIWEYDHQVGKSITGGLVYRGKKLPELSGKYVYADYVSGKIWALKYDEANKKVVSNESIPSDQMPIITFGDDQNGEIYFCLVTPNGKGIYTFEKAQ